MSPRFQVYFIGVALVLLGLGLVLYKNLALELPVLPGANKTVWTIEAKVQFQASGEPVKASLALPKSQANMNVLDEIFSSSGYGFNVEDDHGHQRAIWTKRQALGLQTLYYKLSVYHGLGGESAEMPEQSTEVSPPDWSGMRYEALRGAATSLIESSWQSSSDRETFTGELLHRLNDRRNGDSALIITSMAGKDRVELALELLALADIPGHILRGIYLDDDRSRMNASVLIEVYTDNGWKVFDPMTGAKGLPGNFLIWQRGDRSLLDVEGGSRSRVTFSVLANNVPVRQLALQEMGGRQAALIDYSIYSLPIEQQSIFKFILLMPVGAVVVILMRVVVGLRTAGTFMPVLLAIAFIQTTLAVGVGIFLSILAVGLWVRSYLSRLDLLLISRIASVVVIVVIMMALISIASYKLGIEQALTITFFPMIIIAWTIEHMSILWEDDGPKEVFLQTSGSLFVAVLCYLMMTNRYVEHWMFNFPELMLVLLGMIIILGHYTGYRLFELWRFRNMRELP